MRYSSKSHGKFGGNDLVEPWNVLETPRILLQCFCNLDALDAFMNAPSTWKGLSEVAVLHFYGKTPASRDCRFEFWDRAPRRQEYEKAYYTGDSWVQPFCQPVSQVGIASAAFIGLWLNTGAVQQGVTQPMVVSLGPPTWDVAVWFLQARNHHQKHQKYTKMTPSSEYSPFSHIFPPQSYCNFASIFSSRDDL